MSDPESLRRILEEAKREIDEWPDWMKNQEPSPGRSSREWLLCDHVDQDSDLQEER